MPNGDDRDVGPLKDDTAPAYREIRYEHSRQFAPLLAQLGVSLIVSTYQAGKLVVVGVDQTGALALSFHNFERAMGVAVRLDRVAVGTLNQVWSSGPRRTSRRSSCPRERTTPASWRARRT